METRLLISSGNGPAECEWVVVQLARALAREAGDAGLGAVIADEHRIEKGRARSLLLCLSGDRAGKFAAGLEGTVQWQGQSTFRPAHKRKNWFVGVSVLPAVTDNIDLDRRDVTFQAMRASGPGGQHVNTTDSAVRATHAPTGLTTTAAESRSQHANRKLALVKLSGQLHLLDIEQAASLARRNWSRHNLLERGNPVRTYCGPDFNLDCRKR